MYFSSTKELTQCLGTLSELENSSSSWTKCEHSYDQGVARCDGTERFTWCGRTFPTTELNVLTKMLGVSPTEPLRCAWKLRQNNGKHIRGTLRKGPEDPGSRDLTWDQRNHYLSFLVVSRGYSWSEEIGWRLMETECSRSSASVALWL